MGRPKKSLKVKEPVVVFCDDGIYAKFWIGVNHQSIFNTEE